MFVIKPRNNPTREQISERVALIRRVMMNGTSSTVSARQNATTHGPGVRGAVWVSRITYSKPPETDISESVRKAIDLLGDGTERYRMPEVGELEAQWVGWRPGVDKNTLESSGNDSKKYNCLMREVKSDLTILYVYGGAF
ncbi:hypothetical protein MMC34_005140, partial [Xylographa carneopallida]|nr:hypothetical protein [Xylographa carneopallida]